MGKPLTENQIREQKVAAYWQIRNLVVAVYSLKGNIRGKVDVQTADGQGTVEVSFKALDKGRGHQSRSGSDLAVRVPNESGVLSVLLLSKQGLRFQQ